MMKVWKIIDLVEEEPEIRIYLNQRFEGQNGMLNMNLFLIKLRLSEKSFLLCI